MAISKSVSGLIAKHPKAIVAVFIAIFAAGLPILSGLGIYISIYDLSPRTEYYEHFEVLNKELGWDNLGAVLLVPGDAENVTDPRAVREMYAMEQALHRLPFVEGTVSLARLVMIANQIATGRHEFPPEGELGDRQIEMTIDVVTTVLADQVYGQVLSLDHKSALLVVIMRKGATGEEYRAWQEQLKEIGLEVDESNPYASALTATPLSIDIIYSTLDDVAVTEGPVWVGFTILVCVVFLVYLFRRTPYTLFALACLLVVMTTSLAVAASLGVDFNLLSILVAAFVFAMGIDYTMHVLARYSEERASGASIEEATRRTTEITGRSLFMTSITTTAGFACLYFSQIPAIGTFGIIVGTSVFAAYMSAIMFLPALLSWFDRARGGDARITAAARENQLERVRREQVRSVLGRTAGWLADHRRPMAIVSLVVIAAVAAPLLQGGVTTWGASYLHPHPIFDEDTYAMQALNRMDQTFGIPNELALMMYGDMTDPDVLRYVKRLHDESLATHGRTRTDSIITVFELDKFLNPYARTRDGSDGLPTTRSDILAAYERMENDPAMSLMFVRVMLPDYQTASVRLGVNPSPENSVGRDIDNYRQTRADVLDAVARSANHPAANAVRVADTGLVVLAVEVVDAIGLGNTVSILIMIAVVYAVLFAFWRRPILALIGMTPVVFAVTFQYSLAGVLGYEVNYVSLILTGLVMGIGVDDSVHLIARVREEITRGRSPREALVTANAEVGRVLVATTFTTISPFLILLGSVVTWAAQTAILTIPTLIAALVATIYLMPPILAWHAERFPGDYRMKELPREESADGAVAEVAAR